MPSASKPGVYMILNILTNARYVGGTRQRLSNRFCQHRCLLRQGINPSPDLQAAWNQDGEAVFRFIVLENSPETDCFAREQYWLDHFKALGLTVYNRCPEASSHKSLKMPEWFGEHMRQIHKGKKHKMTPEGLANITKANKGRPRPDVSIRFAHDWPPLTAPDGSVHHVHNLLAFCRVHHLDISALRKVALGLRPSHKGWRKA